jgi:predicted outer membrane protein
VVDTGNSDKMHGGVTMRMQRTLTPFVAAAALALASVAGAQAPAKPETSKSDAKGSLAGADRKFVLEAARGNMTEVELGKLASERASSDAVKQFGQRMATDHGKAYDELKDLAQQKGLALPADLDPSIASSRSACPSSPGRRSTAPTSRRWSRTTART